MPDIAPFRGIRYDPEKAGDLSAVVAPPYDVIPERMQDELYAKSPHNIVRLILNKILKSDNERDSRYTRSKRFFDDWLKKGILKQDERESIYLYSQEYELNGRRMERIGFIALMAIDKTGRVVLPHEDTLASPKLDRLNLMRRVKASLSPIFVLYDDRTGSVVKYLRKFRSRKKPVVDIVFEGVRQRVWAVEDPHAIARIRGALKDKKIFIADGHHRYEVARMYASEVEKSGASAEVVRKASFLMAYFVPADDKMLTVLPTHRAVKDMGDMTPEAVVVKMSKYFTMAKSGSLDSLMMSLVSCRSSHAFGIYMRPGLFYIAKLKDISRSDEAVKGGSKDRRRLDVSILHSFILRRILKIRDVEDNIEFIKEPADAIELVNSGRSKIAFFLNPTKVRQVIRIASLGERMPRKATYFYPKPVSGLVINKL